MHRLLVTVLLLFAQYCLAAAPTISGISCSGGSCTIMGNNFGTKSNGAPPLVFDNYEGYTNGTLWSSMPLYSDLSHGSNNPYVSNSLAKSGSKAFRLDIPLVPITDGSVQETVARIGYVPTVSMTKGMLAVSRYVHQTTATTVDNTGGNGVHNEIRVDKFIRIGSNPTYSGPPLFSDSTTQYTLELINQAGTDIGLGLAGRSADFPTEQWVTSRIIFDYGTPGNADGSVIVTYNGQTIFNFTGLSMTTSSKVIQWAMLWVLFDYYQGTAYSLYLDDFYFDNSQAHVVIANNATFSAATKLAIQPATSWANGSITVNFNQSDFSNGETAYVFIMNENREINATGFSFTIAVGGSLSATIADTDTVTAQLRIGYLLKSAIADVGVLSAHLGTNTVLAAQIASTDRINAFLRPTSRFYVYDTTGFSSKPNMSTFNVYPMLIIYEGTLATDSDNTLHAKFAQAAIDNPGIPWVLDIESPSIQPIVNGAVSSTNINKLLHILQIAKSESNGQRVTFYDLAPKYTTAYDSDPDWQAFIAGHDFFAPDLYITSTTTQASWKTTADALLIRRNQVAPGKPIYPFIWMNFSPTGIGTVDPALWQFQINYLKTNFDSMILWGGYDRPDQSGALGRPLPWDNNAFWWIYLRSSIFSPTPSVILRRSLQESIEHGVKR